MPASNLAVHPDRLSWQPGGPPARLTAQPTIGEALADRYHREPKGVIAYVREDNIWTRVTVEDLWARAVAVARDLRDTGAVAGDTVALCADTSVALLAAVWGSLLLGVAPFIAEPPLTQARVASWASRFRHMVAVTRPAAVLTAGHAADVVSKASTELGLPVLIAPLRPAQPGDAVGLPHPVSPGATAYLQFSSGTTGKAKAVVMTHRQLLANVGAIGRHSGLLEGDLFVGWLPLHHDMGVVGGMFSAFLHSIPFALMPPLSFALRPERWPQSVSYFRATLSAGPNFGYHLCATRIPGEALADVDLRSWRIAFNGAEPVRPATLRLWQDRMGPLGFVPEAMQPCYGMAEVGLAMALSQPGIRPRVVHVDRIELAGSGRVVSVPADHPNAQALTAVGRPLPGYQVRVIGAHGTDLPERRHGQLLLSGPSLTGGYLTADGTVPDNPRDGWLSTGDLGFFAEGDLFVTGRTKDLIVIAGRNYLPDDIEEAAGGLNGVRRGALAALGVPNPDTGTESLVIVVESPIAHIPDKVAELAGQIERAVAERTGLRPDRVVVIRPGGLPKTSSGKLQRHKIASILGGETFSAS